MPPPLHCILLYLIVIVIECDCLWLYAIVSDCMLLYVIVCDCMWLYVIVCDCMWLYLIVCDPIWLYVMVCDRIWLYFFVFYCFRFYLIVCNCLWLYLIVFDCMWLYLILTVNLIFFNWLTSVWGPATDFKHELYNFLFSPLLLLLLLSPDPRLDWFQPKLIISCFLLLHYEVHTFIHTFLWDLFCYS